jgi:hypothetical protein
MGMIDIVERSIVMLIRGRELDNEYQIHFVSEPEISSAKWMDNENLEQLLELNDESLPNWFGAIQFISSDAFELDDRITKLFKVARTGLAMPADEKFSRWA